MFVSKITYSRLKNLGNYENERFDVYVALCEGESVQDAFNSARQLVSQQIREAEKRLDLTSNTGTLPE